MTPQEIEHAAQLLDAARRDAHLVEGLQGEFRPATVEDGFAIQAAITRRRGFVSGWKISGAWPASLKSLNLAAPAAAPIFADYVRTSPAKFDRGRLIAPGLECEFAFVMAKDLPPRDKPYERDEVEAAIGALIPGVEIIDGRIAERTAPSLIADCIGNGAYFRGLLCASWRSLDLESLAITLRVDGNTVARGSGAAIPGGPLSIVTVMANHQPPGSAGLRAGQFVTTGNCTGSIALGDGREIVADFGRLGEIQAEFG